AKSAILPHNPALAMIQAAQLSARGRPGASAEAIRPVAHGLPPASNAALRATPDAERCTERRNRHFPRTTQRSRWSEPQNSALADEQALPRKRPARGSSGSGKVASRFRADSVPTV